MTVKTFFSKLGKPGIVFLTICVIIFVFIIVLVIRTVQVKFQPIQSEYAQIIEKARTERPIRRRTKVTYFVTFELSDGTQKKFIVKESVYNTLEENETGILSYKERNNESAFNSQPELTREFISFEKDDSGP